MVGLPYDLANGLGAELRSRPVSLETLQRSAAERGEIGPVGPAAVRMRMLNQMRMDAVTDADGC